MTRTTRIERCFQGGDLVLYNREVMKVVAVEENSYTTDELTHRTQWVWLENMEDPVDASELEPIRPQEYEPF